MFLNKRNTFIWNYTVIIFLIAVSCNQSEKHFSKINSENESVIQIHLRSREHLNLSYIDTLFRGQLLYFYNSSSNDSVITVYINGRIPVELYASSQGTGLIANPGDTLKLFLNRNGELNTDSCNAKNVLYDKANYFHNTFVFGLHQNLDSKSSWDNFKEDIDSAYSNEQKRINSLFNSSQIDSRAYKQFLIASKITYFRHILNRLDGKSIPDIKTYQKVYAFFPEIENTLKDSSLFITYDLPRMIDALQTLKEESNGINPLNVAIEKEYSIVKKEDYGRFTLPFIASWLNWKIQDRNQLLDTGIVFAANDFIRQNKNSGYSFYVDSLLQHKLNDTKNINDTLTTVEGNSIVWNKLFADKANRLIIVDFWTTWCPPCIDDLPKYDSIKPLLKNKPVEFVFVNINKSKSDWLKFSRNNKFLKYNNYYLPFGTAQIVGKLNITTIPRIIVLRGTRIVQTDFEQPFIKNYLSKINYLLKKEKLE